MTDCSTQTCPKGQSGEETRLLIYKKKNLIGEAVYRGDKEINVFFPIVTGQCLNGLIAGIIEISHKNQININRFVKEREQEKIRNIIKRQKEEHEERQKGKGFAEMASTSQPTAPRV